VEEAGFVLYDDMAFRAFEAALHSTTPR
jgi:hypothetical protein